MPYIQNQGAVAAAAPWNSGELNYSLTKTIDRYIRLKGLSYSTLNEVIGVLECAKLELYRRIAVPYEDLKIEENGDVYDPRIVTDEQE